MSVDYAALVIYGHKINEETYNFIEAEGYDIMREIAKEYNCYINTWCCCEHDYFFGVECGSINIEYNTFSELDFRQTTYFTALDRILKKINITPPSITPKLMLINGISY